MKLLRIVLGIGLLGAAVAAMFSYRPLKAATVMLDATNGPGHIVFQTSSAGAIHVVDYCAGGLVSA
jgi:hypothetical protein